MSMTYVTLLLDNHLGLKKSFSGLRVHRDRQSDTLADLYEDDHQALMTAFERSKRAAPCAAEA
jgi:hypothetical protein